MKIIFNKVDDNFTTEELGELFIEIMKTVKDGEFTLKRGKEIIVKGSFLSIEQTLEALNNYLANRKT